MVSDPESESLEEAFRKHNSGSYRPHMGPSGREFEAYKEGGQSRSKPSFNVKQEYGESQSLQDTFEPGLLGQIAQKLFGSNGPTDPAQGLDEYTDLGDEADEQHGVIDPRNHNVDEVQEWIDGMLEEGDTKAVERVLAAEAHRDARKGVLTYVGEEDLYEFDPETVAEEIQVFDNKAEFAP